MLEGKRLLIYSHDSFGLGHLRRCRAIAHDLVDRFRGLSVLILSGSPIIGSFDFKARVDFVRVPGVIKLRNGEYTSLSLHIDIEKTLEIRSSIIQHTAEAFDPHLFLVDKEPQGLRGEIVETLKMLRQRGTQCILGCRDVMDDPLQLAAEWQRKRTFPVLNQLYDGIWVYGLPEIFDPVREIPGMASVAGKLTYTGYIRRKLPENSSYSSDYPLPERPFLLATAGGGGDGGDLINWVLSAYENDPSIPYDLLVIFGPFMQLEERLAFQARVNNLERVHALTFEARVEPLFERAAGVIAMGGYNTFCEILSFGKPSLIVPRTVPRREQALRAERAEKLGLVRCLPHTLADDPRIMAQAIHDLPNWPRPEQKVLDNMLVGLDRIAELAFPWLEEQEPRRQHALAW